ncbi:serine protease 55-like, partial [Liasis olivaceus]
SERRSSRESRVGSAGLSRAGHELSRELPSRALPNQAKRKWRPPALRVAPTPVATRRRLALGHLRRASERPGCGYRPEFDAPHTPPLGDARIVGGTRARAGKWPWLVSVQTSSFHFCGGSIVHPWWVLSAAHCFTDRRKGIRVAAGSNYLGRSNVTRWVRKIHVHPLYNPKTYDNDLALLLLHKPIPYSWYHTALCLPDRTIVPDDNMWESCFVAGWGLTRAGLQYGSLDLLDTQVGLVDWTLCLRWLRSITRNMVCAGYEQGGRDACQGDSGGPLMCLPPSHGSRGSPRRWYQVGIVSWGRSCAAPRSPGVYTRVANYHSWLEQTSAHDGQPFRVPQIAASHSPLREEQNDLWADVDASGARGERGVAFPSSLCALAVLVLALG